MEVTKLCEAFLEYPDFDDMDYLVKMLKERCSVELGETNLRSLIALCEAVLKGEVPCDSER